MVQHGSAVVRSAEIYRMGHGCETGRDSRLAWLSSLVKCCLSTRCIQDCVVMSHNRPCSQASMVGDNKVKMVQSCDRTHVVRARICS